MTPCAQRARTRWQVLPRLFANLAELAEFGLGGKGRASVYWQKRQNGISAPGQVAPAGGVMQGGGAFDVAVGAATSLVGNADARNAQNQSPQSGEIGLRHRLELSSDTDVTDQSYRSHGFFINMLSKFEATMAA